MRVYVHTYSDLLMITVVAYGPLFERASAILISFVSVKIEEKNQLTSSINFLADCFGKDDDTTELLSLFLLYVCVCFL